MDAAEAPPAPVGDDCFDLREALADVLADDEPAPADPNGASGVQSTVGDGFESIFADFKRGVSATLDEGDFDTRYDLGIAYREMGLFEDAIGEFRVCLDSAQRRFDSLYLMGLCARDLGRFEDAVSHLEQALALPDLPEDRMAGVYFDLSIAEEGAGDRDRARTSVRRVIEIESDFPGAADRLAYLESGQVTSERPGEPSEAFESFDDLFDEDAADEAGDAHIAETVATEALESCDDTPTVLRKGGRKDFLRLATGAGRSTPPSKVPGSPGTESRGTRGTSPSLRSRQDPFSNDPDLRFFFEGGGRPAMPSAGSNADCASRRVLRS